MQELLWLETHIGSLDDGIELANQLYWNITVFQGTDGIWYVLSGEPVIFKSDSRESVDAFLYGLGLAYGVLPPEVFDQLREELRKWVE
jgi:hypothetical protein